MYHTYQIKTINFPGNHKSAYLPQPEVVLRVLKRMVMNRTARGEAPISFICL